MALGARPGDDARGGRNRKLRRARPAAVAGSRSESGRARERAEQQMDDFAQELADDFKQFMQNNIFPEIDDFFAQLNNQVDKLRDSFSEQERFVSDQLQKWLSVQQIALKA